MSQPQIITFADRSRAVWWPRTGRLTVAAGAGGIHDRDREPCLAGDAAAAHNARVRDHQEAPHG